MEKHPVLVRGGIKMTDKFDEFLERLEGPLPEPRMKPFHDSFTIAQTACSDLDASCIHLAVHFLSASCPYRR